MLRISMDGSARCMQASQHNECYESAWTDQHDVCELPSIINATNQRGRISTMYARLEVAEEDRAYFFKHMGHSEHVNVGTYQRPLPVLAMTKVGAELANIDASMAVQKRTKPQEPQGNAANTMLFEKLHFPKVLQLVMTIIA